MRPGRWLAAGLILLGAVVAATALLGPLVTDVIHYRTSDTTLKQIVGGDAAALVIVAPFTVAVGVLALRGHPAAPVLAVAPAGYVLYTYAQLIVGQEYLRLPGNNERFFPLLLAGFVLAGSVAVGAWRAVDPEHLPRAPGRLDRAAAGVLLFVAAHLVFGLHLRGFVDAMRDTPSRIEYVSSPTPFWLVKLMDLGIVVPVAVAAAVGLLRGSARARRPVYAIVGAYALLAASVAGMAITMLAHGDPDSSVPTVVAFVYFAVALTALAVALYRPLFARRGRRAAAGDDPTRKGEDPMRVLVSAASRHGATAEIAERIGVVLRRSLAQRDPGVEVVVLPAQEVGRVDGFDGFVLGSAVYMGHWLESARDLVRRNAETLTGRPVWFSPAGRSVCHQSPTSSPSMSVRQSRRPERGSTGCSPASSTGTGSVSRSGPWCWRCGHPRATSGTGLRSRRGRSASPMRSNERLAAAIVPTRGWEP